MAGFIEGIGDEVIWFLTAVIVIVLISLAWISTGIPPVDYYVWLVQMQIHPTRRIVQVLQVDNEEVNLFRGRREGRYFSTATAEALPVMDSGVVEQSNASQIALLPETARVVQRQVNEGTSQHEQELSQTEQATSMAESREDLIRTTISRTETDNWQYSADLPSLTPVENGKNSPGDVKHELSSVVSGMDSDGTGRHLSNVKLKFLDDSQVIAYTTLESTVGQFKRRYFWESILAGKIVRLIYRGQLLRDDTRSLLSYGLHDQCVVHCHVSSTPYAQPSSSGPNAASNVVLSHESSALSGSQSVSVSATSELTQTLIQTFGGHSIGDSQNDSLLIRVQNAFLRAFRYGYNVVMGPDPRVTTLRGASLDAAADAAALNEWNHNENAVGRRIGQNVQIIFIVKFLILWTFVFLFPQYTDRFSLLLLTFLSMFFVSILFSNAHRSNSSGMQTEN